MNKRGTLHLVRTFVLAGALCAASWPTLSGCSSESVGHPGTAHSNADTSGLPVSPVTDRLVECMKDAGWDVERSWQGGVETDEIPASQQTAYQAANDKCSKSSGWAAANGNLAESQVRELYAQEVASHECLLAAGIDSAEPPSEQTYLDTFHTKDQYVAFLPGFDSLGQAQMQAAVRKCPPPTWFLNVSGL